MRGLVTGGAGFIVSHLCERLAGGREGWCLRTSSQKEMGHVDVDGKQYFLRQGESTFIRAGDN